MEQAQAFDNFLQAGTAALSNTICIAQHGEQCSGVSVESLTRLNAFGDVARMDSSLGPVLNCVLVTFFDVRCAQKALTELPGQAEMAPAGHQDFRIVVVNTAAYAAKLGLAGGFNQFGEVANVSICHGDAVVEYYDLRAAQRLCALAGGCATPCLPRGQAVRGSVEMSRSLSGMLDFRVPSPCPGAGSQMLTGACTEQGVLPEQAPACVAGLTKESSESTVCTASPSQPPSPAERSSSDKGSTPPCSEARGNRLIRTKVSNKDFAKYDIHPDRIQRGEDVRTTVMVRNLVGAKARKDFLKFLERGSLQSRYTFFYMPCKEHRDVRAGFAFVNFKSAEDVRALFNLVRGDVWQEMRRSCPQYKPLAVSYARFQGHDELVEHFSSSVVLHEQDPEKRPIFCPEGASQNKGGSRAEPKQKGQETMLRGRMNSNEARTTEPMPQPLEDPAAPPGLLGPRSAFREDMPFEDVIAMAASLNTASSDETVQSVLAALQPWAVQEKLGMVAEQQRADCVPANHLSLPWQIPACGTGPTKAEYAPAYVSGISLGC